MNMRLLAESLTFSEVEELSSYLLERRKDVARDKVRHYTLTSEEHRLNIVEGKVAAIKAVRERLGLTLMEAKVLVELDTGDKA